MSLDGESVSAERLNGGLPHGFILVSYSSLNMSVILLSTKMILLSSLTMAEFLIYGSEGEFILCFIFSLGCILQTRTDRPRSLPLKKKEKIVKMNSFEHLKGAILHCFNMKFVT